MNQEAMGQWHDSNNCVDIQLRPTTRTGRAPKKNKKKHWTQLNNLIYLIQSKIEKNNSTAEKSEFETIQFSDYKDQFQWFLAIGLFFLIIDIFLFEKKTKWSKKVDLFNEEKSKN